MSEWNPHLNNTICQWQGEFDKDQRIELNKDCVFEIIPIQI